MEDYLDPVIQTSERSEPFIGYCAVSKMLVQQVPQSLLLAYDNATNLSSSELYRKGVALHKLSFGVYSYRFPVLPVVESDRMGSVVFVGVRN